MKINVNCESCDSVIVLDEITINTDLGEEILIWRIECDKCKAIYHIEFGFDRFSAENFQRKRY